MKKWIALCLTLCLAGFAGCSRKQNPPASDGSTPLPTGNFEESGSAPAVSDDDSGDTSDEPDPPDQTDEPTTYPEPEPGYFEPSWDSAFTQESVVNRNVHSSSRYLRFQQISEATYLIPGLKQHFIPQGMDVWQEKEWLLISGYFQDKTYSDCSVLFAVDLNTGEFVGEYSLKNASGSNHTSHVGGVAVAGDNLYLSNSSSLYRIDLAQLEQAAPKGTLTIRETIRVPVRASFCNYSGGILWVGDFYIPGNSSYSTPDYQKMKNNGGGTYGAWCVGYELTDETENGFRTESWSQESGYMVPDCIFSIDQKIQGFAVVGSRVALSQSYGRTNDSKILLYENPMESAPHQTVELGGKTVPLWFLDGSLDMESYTAPPMTEGLASFDGTLLILFESGATYYKDDGGINPTDRVWVMHLPEEND